MKTYPLTRPGRVQSIGLASDDGSARDARRYLQAAALRLPAKMVHAAVDAIQTALVEHDRRPRQTLNGVDAMKILSGAAYMGEANIVCPTCGSNEIDIMRAGTLLGSDPHEGNHVIAGTLPIGRTGARREVMEIVCGCQECRQEFALMLQSHKGLVQIAIEMVQDEPRPSSAATKSNRTESSN
jgi:hypothetical protein